MIKKYLLLLSLMRLACTAGECTTLALNDIRKMSFQIKALLFKRFLEEELAQSDQQEAERREKILKRKAESYRKPFEMELFLLISERRAYNFESDRRAYINSLKYDAERRKTIHTLSSLDLLSSFKHNSYLDYFNRKVVRCGPPREGLDFSYRIEANEVPQTFKMFETLDKQYPDYL